MTGTKQWWLPWVFFTGIGTLIVFPWFLAPGFLFLLDFVWAPTLQPPLNAWQAGHVSSWPWLWFWWALSQMIETSAVQKLAFALPWLLAGVSMYHLAAWIVTAYTKSTSLVRTLAALGAAMFYLVNPFVFTRAVMGQAYLLLAYALVPWALLAWLIFLERPAVKVGLGAGAAAAAVMLTNAHHMILLPLLLLFFIRRPQRGEFRAWLVCLAPIITLVLLTLLAQRAASTGTATFDPQGPWARALQAPHSGNVLLDTLTLTATWKLDLPFLFPYESLAGFTAATLGLLIVMLTSIVYACRQPVGRLLQYRLVALILVSSLLAIGVAHPTTSSVAAWLYQHLPGWIGLRDSAKFLSLIAVAEAMLLPLGISAVAAGTRRYLSDSVAAIVAVFPLLTTLYLGSAMVVGFDTQIYPLPYPESWYGWNEKLSGIENSPRMLFLPWHQYLPFTFTADRTVINPAPDFFSNAIVIAGDNSEVGGQASRPFIYSESTRPLSGRLEAILAEAPQRTDFGWRLAAEHIRYVALATDTWDTNRYRYLYRQRDLTLVFEGPELVVWENRAVP